MFKRSFFKILGIATLALTLSVGLISSAFAAGGTPTATPTTAPTAAPTAAPTTAPAKPAQAAACSTANAKWNSIQPQTSENGLLVTGIAKGSPAAMAGLAVDRIVLSVNGKSISQQADLDAMVAAAKAGDKLTLEVASEGGSPSKIMIKVGTDSGKPFVGITGSQVPVEMGPFTLSETTPATCSSKPFELSSSIARGLYIMSVDANSPAATAGLVAGNVLIDANGKAVGTPDVFSKMIGGLKAGTALTLGVYNPLTSKYSDVKITMGSSTSLGAQLGVIVEPASASSSTTSYKSPKTYLQDVFMSIRQWASYMRHHRFFSFGSASVTSSSRGGRSIFELGTLSFRQWMSWFHQHLHLGGSRFFTRP